MPDVTTAVTPTPVKPIVTPPAPSAKPPAPAVKPAAPEADTLAVSRPRPPAPDLHGADKADPGTLGSAVVLHGIVKSKIDPIKVARAAKGGAQVGTNAAAGSLSGFLAAFKAGLKTNVIVAGALSVVTNGVDALKGRINMKQFLGLTAADTVAYTGIGALATASATLAPALVGLVPALAFAAPVLGVGIALAVGIGGSLLYGKLGHETIKDALR